MADTPQTRNTDIRADIHRRHRNTNTGHSADPHLFSLPADNTPGDTRGHRDGHILMLEAQLLCTPALRHN